MTKVIGSRELSLNSMTDQNYRFSNVIIEQHDQSYRFSKVVTEQLEQNNQFSKVIIEQSDHSNVFGSYCEQLEPSKRFFLALSLRKLVRTCIIWIQCRRVTNLLDN